MDPESPPDPRTRMPALSFPNADALRLALATGIVPSEVAREPVRGGTDANGRPWVEVPTGFPRDATAALARIGVTVHGPGTGPDGGEVCRWDELLPLRRTPAGREAGPVLFHVPAARLAALAAEVRRLRPQGLGFRILPDSGRALLLAPDPPYFTVQGDGVELFVSQAPRVWVLAGWEHPLDNQVKAPDGVVVLLRPGRPWQIIRDEPFRREPESIAVGAGRAEAHPAPGPHPAPVVSIRLAPGRPGGTASLWVLDGPARERLTGLFGDADERLLHQFVATEVRLGDRTATVVRVAPGTPGPVWDPGVPGFVADPALGSLHLPAGMRFVPPLRPRQIMDRLGLREGTVAWAVPGPGAVEVHQVPETAFRSVASWVEYRTAPRVKLAPVVQEIDPFALPRFVTLDEQPAAVDRAPQSDAPPSPAASPPEGAHEGWFSRLAGLIFAGKSGPQRARRRGLPTARTRVPPRSRVGDKLASPQTLLGNERSARRAALESRVLLELPRLPPAARAELWAELAETYTAIGNPADAAQGWLCAIWDGDPAAGEWAGNWLRAEARSARVAHDGREPDAILHHPPGPAAARVAAAHLAWKAAAPPADADSPAHLHALLSLVDTHEKDLPVRAIWLARTAFDRLSDGDALGAARCRDRLFARLMEHGPGLDLDAPSFLRFRGAATGDHVQTARDWLGRIREPVHRWIAKHAPAGRLQWAGIDPEVQATTAYADLILAWGLSRLGDRARAREYEADAARVLDRAAGPGVDAAVHRVLRAAFTDRIRSAQDGRSDRPGLPLGAAAELPRLDDLGRYAVDKLRAHCGVLEPIDRVNPYRGRELNGFLGSDALGERLTRFLARPDLAPDPAAVQELLTAAAADSTAAVLPRVVFALLELGPRLTPAQAAGVVRLAAPAIDLMPEWVRLGGPGVGSDPTAVALRFGARALAAACHAAGLHDLTDAFAEFAAAVRTAADSPGSVVVAAVGQEAGRFFRTLRRLGLGGSARDLLAAVPPGDPVGPRELGLSAGYFAAGAEEAGTRVLDAARDRLFVAGIPDERERTAAAIAYAAALGHAPPRVALGRLEELFLRLDTLATHGATNRYYTLKPLELIDAAVRAVVTDDFALGPDVRGWLDDDELLIRRRISRDLAAALAKDPGR